MPSGNIISKCPVCDKPVYDDEWTVVDDTIVHDMCKNEYMLRLICSGGKEKVLTHIREEIDDLNKDIDENFRYYTNKIKRLENELENLKKIGSDIDGK